MVIQFIFLANCWHCRWHTNCNEILDSPFLCSMEFIAKLPEHSIILIMFTLNIYSMMHMDTYKIRLNAKCEISHLMPFKSSNYISFYINNGCVYVFCVSITKTLHIRRWFHLRNWTNSIFCYDLILQFIYLVFFSVFWLLWRNCREYKLAHSN